MISSLIFEEKDGNHEYLIIPNESQCDNQGILDTGLVISIVDTITTFEMFYKNIEPGVSINLNLKTIKNMTIGNTYKFIPRIISIDSNSKIVQIECLIYEVNTNNKTNKNDLVKIGFHTKKLINQKPKF